MKTKMRIGWLVWGVLSPSLAQNACTDFPAASKRRITSRQLDRSSRLRLTPLIASSPSRCT